MFDIINHQGNEMQVKTTMRYHFTPTRMTRIKKSDSNKGWLKCGKVIKALICCGQECEMMQSLENGLASPQVLVNIMFLYDPAISLLGI